MTEFGLQLRNHLRSHTWMAYIPGLYRSLDLPDVAALSAPGALLVQQCARDTLYPLAARRRRRPSSSASTPRPATATASAPPLHDEPHSFRPAMQDEAFAWLDRWLAA